MEVNDYIIISISNAQVKQITVNIAPCFTTILLIDQKWSRINLIFIALRVLYGLSMILYPALHIIYDPDYKLVLYSNSLE